MGSPAGVFMDPEIKSIHYRSQDVVKGGLFVAIHGFISDGHDFIDDAIENGASAIITEKPIAKEIPIVTVENSRKALSAVASRFFKDPSKRLCLIGVTGTNGKTTVTYLIESILLKANISTGVIGTINYRYCEKTFPNPVTTPESLDIQRILSEMIEHGVTHAVMEVSSHAIDLFRVNNCLFDIGVFTNLSQDHLDFHKNMDAYWACKKKFFTENLSLSLKKNKARAVINCDDEKGRALAKEISIPILTIGRSDGNMIRPGNSRYDRTGITAELITPSGTVKIESPLVGEYNLENMLCATGVGVALGLPIDAIKAGIEGLSCVPGRLEAVPNRIDRFVYVDYAHTPDALKNVLSLLRGITTDRIICIFGCGGDRDKDKRPQMGAIASKLSDLCIITSDNPRTEPPMEIIDQIQKGVQNNSLYKYTPDDLKNGFFRKGYVIEPNRKDAIRLGIMVSGQGDTVLIAGKGHETYQIIGKTSVAFDDRAEAKIALEKLGDGK